MQFLGGTKKVPYLQSTLQTGTKITEKGNKTSLMIFAPCRHSQQNAFP